ncbi:MAG: ABC transporter permease [Pyrinomonadaceae bacterium]
MENINKNAGDVADNSQFRKIVGLIYVCFLILLAISLGLSYYLDYKSESESFQYVGFVAFVLFYLVSTGVVIWFVRTNKANSLWADAWKRLLRNKLATFGLVVLWVITLTVAVGPSIIYWLTGLTPDLIPPNSDLIKSFPPSLLHPMGTDEAGRDLLSRVLQGGRISLMVGIISTVVSLIVGVSYGATAGYLGGKIDDVMMRFVDIIYAIPYILIVIVLLQVFGGDKTGFLIKLIPVVLSTLVMLLLITALLIRFYRSMHETSSLRGFQLKALTTVISAAVIVLTIWFNTYLYSWFLGGFGQWIASVYDENVNQGLSQIFLLFFALGLVSWLTMARVVRGQILSLKNQEFVLAARATGVSTFKIIFKHLVPNALGPVIVYATLTVPSVMLTEAFLSFLGIGVQAPYASWGSLASDGIKNIAIFPWQLIFPGVTMALTLFSLNFLGDGLRDALDPQTRKF